jgi:outer membrane protein assembly factor BamB
MNRKQSLFLLLVFLFSILFSCDQQKDEFENLNLTAVWEKDLCAGSNSLNIDNRILYFNNNDHETRGIGGLNIETGETLWISKKIGYNLGNCVFDDSNVYAMNYVRKDKENEVYENLITIIDKENGEIKSQNKISGSTPRRSSQWTLYNDTLYWGGRDRHFVHAYNTQDDADSYKVWGSEDVTADIMGDIVPYNGRLYFVAEVYPYIDDPKPSRLISMLPDGTDVKELEIPVDFVGVDTNAIQIYEGKLYLNGTYFICLDPETFKIEWELKRDEGFYSSYGFTIHEGKIYTATNINSCDSVFCIDAKKGKIIWQEKLDSSYGTIGYQPQVYKGYVYLPTQSSLIVLNAKTGKYVGRDERLETGALSLGKTISYNDLLIVSAPLINKMYAVKMDMHTR